ncbi:MAG: glycoside hydrolase family 5 protein [Nitrososphaera sp.]
MKAIANNSRKIQMLLGISVSVILVASVIPSSYAATDCSDIPVKNFKGVVFMDKTLGRDEDGGKATSSGYVAQSMKHIKSNGFNAIRVPYTWESYVYSSTAFMNEIELIAKTAQSYGICVIFDNHHYYTTSFWNLEVDGKSDGRGFPSFVVKNFPKKNNDYIDTARPFWNAFLSNNISIDGKKVWDVQFAFFSKIINKVDGYTSVAGYEILNEPHLFQKEHYAKLGDYNTYIAKKIRTITDKKIFFDRETTRGFQREPSLEPKIVPRGVSGLVYAPHLYGVPTPGSQGMKQINNIKDWSTDWGTEVLIGEWGADSKTDAITFLKAFKANGFGWTAHSWKRGSSGGLGSTLYESDTVDATPALKNLVAALITVY